MREGGGTITMQLARNTILTSERTLRRMREAVLIALRLEREFSGFLAVEQARGRYIIVHRCLKCGQVKRNKSSPDDSSRALVEVARRRAMS